MTKILFSASSPYTATLWVLKKKYIQISTVKVIASAVAGRRLSEGTLTSEAENTLVFEDSSDFLYFVLKHGLQ